MRVKSLWRWLQRPSAALLLLAALALWDLRIELQLLLQHFTWTALGQAIAAHPLAVAVLLLIPNLQDSSNGRSP